MQLTRRGFKTAAEAAQARRELLVQVKSGRLKPAAAGTTVNELLDLYLDGLDADGRLSAKTALRLPPLRRQVRPAPPG